LPDEQLTAEEIATLVALANVCNFDLSAHPPLEHICRKFPTHLRGDTKKNLDKLRRKGYCQKHPTGGSTTWNITQKGVDAAVRYLENPK
jgi:hypothetical protein